MNKFDLKKFVTGFLVLAALASSSILIFSGGPGGAPQAETANKNLEAKNAPPTISENAFVESLPQRTDGGTVARVPFYSSNLTDTVASTFARELVQNNPSGLLTTADGASVVAVPDTETILNEIASGGTAAKVKIPDWEKDVAAETAGLKITDAEDSSAIEGYASAFSGAFEKNFVETKAEDVLSSESPDSANLLKAASDQTITDMKRLPVPKPLKDFHGSYVRLLVYQRNALGLVENASEDPLKSALVMQAHEGKFNLALLDFQNQFQKVAYLFDKNAPQQSAVARTVNKILGIQTARAFLGFGDISFNPIEFARTLWEWAYKILLDFVRDRIIHRLVQQTIQWIQGGGKPQFVTNWKGFLGGVASDAAGTAIDEIAPGFCRPWAPLLRMQLENTYLSSPPMQCTLDQVVANAKAFYDDFSQGGWLGYQAMVLPSGNFFGQFFEGSQIVALRQFADREAAKAELDAGQGFGSQEVCVDFEMISPEDECIRKQIQLCEENVAAGNDAGVTDCREYAFTFCGSRSLSEVEQKKCKPDGYEITTPGQAIGQNLYNALGSPIQRIVNAQDIRALVSALVNSALNKLTKLIAGKPNPSGLLGISPSTIGTAVGGQGTGGACNGLSGSALVACQQKEVCGNLTGEELKNCLSDWKEVNCPTSEGAEQTQSTVTGAGPEGGEQTSSGRTQQQIQLCTGGPTVTPGGGGGGDDCGDKAHCTCNSTATPGAAALQYKGAVEAAQGEVAKNPAASGLDPNDTGKILDFDAYHKAVVCELRSKGYLADHDGEEINIARPGDTFQENLDISTAGGRTWTGDNAVCRSVNGDGAYPAFVGHEKVTCP